MSDRPIYGADFPDATPLRAIKSNKLGQLIPADTTDVELEYLDGVTSSIQTQLDTKEDTIALTGNRAVASDSDGALVASDVTDTELDRLDGIVSDIQTRRQSMSFVWGGEIPNSGLPAYFPKIWIAPMAISVRSAHVYSRDSLTGFQARIYDDEAELLTTTALTGLYNTTSGTWAVASGSKIEVAVLANSDAGDTNVTVTLEFEVQ